MSSVATIKLENSEETAVDKAEEGGDDVKSSWPLCLGLHTYYNGIDNGKLTREGALNLINYTSIRIAL